MAEHFELSIVIPFFNEEQALPLLKQRLDAVLGLPEKREILLISDGSTDGSVPFIEKWCQEDPRIVLIELSRNFGQQAAIRAGLDAAAGQRIGIMDADLQDSPEDLVLMDEELRRGDWDFVYAVRGTRTENILKRAVYRTYYYLYSILSDYPAIRDSGDFCVLSRRTADILRSFPERVQYLRGLRCWIGLKSKAFETDRSSRSAGDPRYTLGKLMSLGINGIVSFSAKPLRVATIIGTMMCGFSILLSIGYLAAWMLYDIHLKAPGFTTLVVLLLFLNGMQMLIFGLVGEYIRQIFLEVKGRPVYITSRIVGQTRK